MTRPPGLLPTHEERDILAAAQLVEREDSDPTYVRYAHVSLAYGIVYASAMPLQWGFYWRTPCRVTELVWARELLTLFDLIAELK